jgi:putative hydrolase of the HAD superfamily
MVIQSSHNDALKRMATIKTYLFDWGDTLMVDLPDETGKMCDWKVVEAVEGAKETLASLSKYASIYIATGAADSTEQDIKLAFERVGLSEFISGYFCQDNLGQVKGTPGFLEAICLAIDEQKENVAMIGDNVDKDIKPALAAGVQPVWLTSNLDRDAPKSVYKISRLTDLCAQ